MQAHAEPQIRFKIEEFDALAISTGLGSDYARSRVIGPTESTFHRVRHGKAKPGERFVAQILAWAYKIPRPEGEEVRFEDLFEVAA